MIAKRHLKLIPLIIFCLILFVGCSGINTGDFTQDTYQVTAEVLDENDDPLEGAEVIAGGDTIGTTDENGSVTLPELVGDVTIEVRHDNYVYSEEKVTSNDSGTTVTFRPDPYASLDDVEGLAIKGYFGDQASTMADGTVESTSETDIDKVVLIYKRDYQIAEVNEDGAFIAELRNEPCGVAFVDETGQFAGHLVVAGMNSIPAHLIDEELEEIDLGEIIIEDEEASSDYDLDDVEISDQDLETMAVAGSLFSAVAMSPDMVEYIVSETGKIDVGISYYGSHNEFAQPADGLVTVEEESSLRIKAHRLFLSFHNPLDTSPDDMKIYYPGDDPILEVDPDNDEVQEDSVWFPAVEADTSETLAALPKSGDYHIESEVAEIEFGFTLPTLSSEAEENLVVPIPTVKLDADDKVEEITWVYKTLAGDILENPEKIVFELEVQISGNEEDGNRIYSSGNIPIQDDNHIDLSGEDISWDEISNISMAYNDVFNVHYVIPFDVAK